MKNSGITVLDASIKMAFRLHKAHKELKEKEQALRMKDRAIEASINAIAVSCPDGNLSYVNPAALSLWGYDDAREVLGKPVIDFLQEPERVPDIKQALLFSGKWVGEMRARKRRYVVRRRGFGKPSHR